MNAIRNLLALQRQDATTDMDTGPVILELPFPCLRSAKRALIRSVYRRAAMTLRDELGYPGAARALEELADKMRTRPDPVDDFEDVL